MFWLSFNCFLAWLFQKNYICCPSCVCVLLWCAAPLAGKHGFCFFTVLLKYKCSMMWWRALVLQDLFWKRKIFYIKKNNRMQYLKFASIYLSFILLCSSVSGIVCWKLHDLTCRSWLLIWLLSAIEIKKPKDFLSQSWKRSMMITLLGGA